MRARLGRSGGAERRRKRRSLLQSISTRALTMVSRIWRLSTAERSAKTKALPSLRPWPRQRKLLSPTSSRPHSQRPHSHSSSTSTSMPRRQPTSLNNKTLPNPRPRPKLASTSMPFSPEVPSAVPALKLRKTWTSSTSTQLLSNSHKTPS